VLLLQAEVERLRREVGSLTKRAEAGDDERASLKLALADAQVRCTAAAVLVLVLVPVPWPVLPKWNTQQCCVHNMCNAQPATKNTAKQCCWRDTSHCLCVSAVVTAVVAAGRQQLPMLLWRCVLPVHALSGWSKSWSL
jgi:hypothetical protein